MKAKLLRNLHLCEAEDPKQRLWKESRRKLRNEAAKRRWAARSTDNCGFANKRLATTTPDQRNDEDTNATQHINDGGTSDKDESDSEAEWDELTEEDEEDEDGDDETMGTTISSDGVDGPDEVQPSRTSARRIARQSKWYDDFIMI